MQGWNEAAVSAFLGLRPKYSHAVTYDIPLCGESIVIAIDVRDGKVTIEGSESLSAYIRCTAVHINREPAEEGGQCLIFNGPGGHVAVSPGSPYFKIFFSMYGQNLHD
jgi:hypothetical protein